MTDEINHAERAHARLGASSCERWWNCPGSVRLSEGIPEVPPSRYALEGTAAHTLAQMCLTKSKNANDYLNQEISGFIVTDDMAEAVQIYIDICRTYIQYPGLYSLIEAPFSLTEIGPPEPMFGTADFVAVDRDNRRLTVIDLKYGQGISVDAQDNPQLKFYALGALLVVPKDWRITTIQTIIVQPRTTGERVKFATYKVSELIEWAAELMVRAKATREPDAPLSAGKWCRFCPAAGRCPEQTRKAYEAACIEFTPEPRPTVRLPELRLITPEMLGEMLKHLPLVEDFVKSAREAAKQLLRQDVTVPGWKLTPGLGHRKWANPDSVEAELSKLSLTVDEIYKKEAVSPAQAEKLLVRKLRDKGKKTAEAEEIVKDYLNNLTKRPETEPSLVPASSSLPGLPAPGSEFTVEKKPVT